MFFTWDFEHYLIEPFSYNVFKIVLLIKKDEKSKNVSAIAIHCSIIQLRELI